MLDIFAQFATDETLENQGVWVEYGEAKFLVGRSGNRAYSKKLSALVEQNQKLLDIKDEAAEALSQKIFIEVMAESILLGWSGPVAYKGEPLPFSRDAVRQLLEIKDFRREVTRWAEDINRFKARVEEAQVKN